MIAAPRFTTLSRAVLFADEIGRLPRVHASAAHWQGHRVVAVGGLSALREVLTFAQTGAAVVDGDLPLPTVLRALAGWLTRCVHQGVRSHSLDPLRALCAAVDRMGGLTRREQEVLAALADGLTAAEIAGALFLSLTTVRTHIRAILRKLAVTNQLAAVAAAQQTIDRTITPGPRVPCRSRVTRSRQS